MDQSEDLYHQAAPVLLPQDQPQNDAELEPIDLEEVQKIQARMPAADPNAPIGSNKNPIRIIQQGNQYITTQDVSDEQLQQIIQVLTNQALISNSGTRPSAIYNRLTNRRIIFRVTRAKRRNDENNQAGGVGNIGKTVTSCFSKDAKKSLLKKRRRTSDNEDPDFEPEVPEEEVLPFPLSRRSAASGRISKPPKHLVKDYKHLRPEDLTTKQDSSDEDDHSDGGYSDYINDGLMSEENWSDDGIGDQFNCNICQKGFGTRAGLARHHTLTHGPNHNRARGRWANPYMANVRRRAKLKEVLAEATDDDLVEFIAPRLAKLTSPWDHLLMRSEQGNPPLPQVHRLMSDYLSLAERVRAFLGDQLTAKSRRRGQTSSNGNKKNGKDDEAGTGDDGDADADGKDNENVRDDDTDEDETSEDEDRKTVITVAGEEQSTALNLPVGKYTVQHPLREEYLPRRFRSVLIAQRAAGFPNPSSSSAKGANTNNNNSAATATTTATGGRISITSGGGGVVEHSGQTKRALVAMETADDDGAMALRQDVDADSSGDVAAGQAIRSENDTLAAAVGDELVLLPEGGLGGPVPDAWLESGAFLAVLTETGQTSELVMEAATGRLFHRPTGHLVSLSDGQADEQQSTATLQQQQEGNVVVTTSSDLASQQEQTESGKGSDETSSAQLAADAGEVIDLNTLFPGVTVTEVSAGVCLVTKPNGDRFNVEHGGEGITLETLQAILQM